MDKQTPPTKAQTNAAPNAGPGAVPENRPAGYRRSSALEAMGLAAMAEGYTRGDTWLGERNANANKRLGLVNLRCDPSDKAAFAAVKKVIGTVPPTGPCTAVTGTAVTAKDISVLWLAPDEWLIVSANASGKRIAKDIHAAAGTGAGAGNGNPVHLSAINLTSNYATIRIGGPNAINILQKMLPVDLHEDEFKPGDVRGTMAVKAQIFLHKLTPDQSPGPAGEAAFDLYVRRSFAAYVWNYLVDAGREFDVKIAGTV